MNRKVNEVTCKQCGTVHYAITFEEASINVKNFNHYYFSLTEKEQKEMYGDISPTGMLQYEQCSVCKNPYTNFRNATDDDAPIGVTLSPILGWDENEN